MAEQVIGGSAPYGEGNDADGVVYEKAEGVAADVGQLSLGRLIWRRFLRNRLAVSAGIVLVILYTLVLFADFFAAYDPLKSDEDFVARQPQIPRFIDSEGNFYLRPFVYGTTTSLDTENFDWVHEDNPEEIYPIHFFVQGRPWKLLGLFEINRHLLWRGRTGDRLLDGHRSQWTRPGFAYHLWRPRVDDSRSDRRDIDHHTRLGAGDDFGLLRRRRRYDHSTCHRAADVVSGYRALGGFGRGLAASDDIGSTLS